MSRIETESEIVRGVRNGDREAFKKMFHAYYPDLCTFAASYVDSSYARDLVQDVFLRIWESRSEWTIHTSLKAYLYRAVRNHALNEDRGAENRKQFEDHYERSVDTVERRTARDQLQYDELSEALQALIDELPDRQRMVFLLHRRHGFTYAEIAAIMDITVQTVETHMGRGLKFLRKRIESTSSISI